MPSLNRQLQHRVLPAPGTAITSSSSEPQILLVEGAGSTNPSLRTILAGLGCRVIEVDSTAEAVAVVANQEIDLVLLDMSAPEIGGPSFCKLLKRNPFTKFLPIFMVASSDDVESEVLAINAGADEYLVRPLRIEAVRARIQASLRHKAMIDELDTSEALLFSLAQSVEDADPAIGTHCERLAVMGTAMGLTLGLPAADILALQRGGYLHDIGKISIPDKILFKAGPLSPEEWEVMRSHAERGERICRNIGTLDAVLPIVRHHHERWDGSGYPDRLRADEIPLLARIVQIADIYDALTTQRPYKPAFSSEEAICILQEEAARGWRDPFLVKIFSDVLPTFRTPAVDAAGGSLQSLAASVDQYQRQQPARSSTRSGLNRVASRFDVESIKLVSGL